MPNNTEVTFSQELTKSVDQILSQLSITNVNVPRIDQFINISDFIAEFEMVTAMLPDLHKVKLIVKAFPTGRYSAWFDTNLKPKLDSSSWASIRELISNVTLTSSREKDISRRFKI